MLVRSLPTSAPAIKLKRIFWVFLCFIVLFDFFLKVAFDLEQVIWKQFFLLILVSVNPGGLVQWSLTYFEVWSTNQFTQNIL